MLTSDWGERETFFFSVLDSSSCNKFPQQELPVHKISIKARYKINTVLLASSRFQILFLNVMVLLWNWISLNQGEQNQEFWNEVVFLFFCFFVPTNKKMIQTHTSGRMYRTFNQYYYGSTVCYVEPYGKYLTMVATRQTKKNQPAALSGVKGKAYICT